MEDTPLPEYKKPGVMGADTAEVLSDLGYSDDQINDLATRKVVELKQD